jgi:hypothetical protein
MACLLSNVTVAVMRLPQELSAPTHSGCVEMARSQRDFAMVDPRPVLDTRVPAMRD